MMGWTASLDGSLSVDWLAMVMFDKRVNCEEDFKKKQFYSKNFANLCIFSHQQSVCALKL